MEHMPHADVPLRVLVVDDQEDSADAVACILSMMGHDVHIAYGPREALEKFREELAKGKLPIMTCALAQRRGIPVDEAELRAQELDRHLLEGHAWQIQALRQGQPWGIFLLMGKDGKRGQEPIKKIFIGS